MKIANSTDVNFTVRSYEAGIENHVTLPTLCNYMQEAAGISAANLGWGIRALQDEGLTWMLSRLRVSVARYVPWGETVTVRTWPSGMKGRLVAKRCFLGLDKTGAELFCASSEVSRPILRYGSSVHSWSSRSIRAAFWKHSSFTARLCRCRFRLSSASGNCRDRFRPTMRKSRGESWTAGRSGAPPRAASAKTGLRRSGASIPIVHLPEDIVFPVHLLDHRHNRSLCAKRLIVRMK